MALPATIYRVSIQLSDIDRDCYATLTTTAAKHPSETDQRLIARLIAYALCYEENIAFTRGVSFSEEPDLWVKGYDDSIHKWIEVGLPDAQRLVKAGHHSEQVVLFTYGSGTDRWLTNSRTQLATMDNLQVFRLSDKLIDALLAKLKRSIDWQLTCSDKTLYFMVDGENIVADLLEIDLNDILEVTR